MNSIHNVFSVERKYFLKKKLTLSEDILKCVENVFLCITAERG